MHPASRRVVQSPDATSSAYFTVSHQNGLSISIQSARNLDLVCISYLYAHPVFSALHAFFLGSAGLGSDRERCALVGRCRVSCDTTPPKKITVSFGIVDFIEDFSAVFQVALLRLRKHTCCALLLRKEPSKWDKPKPSPQQS